MMNGKAETRTPDFSQGFSLIELLVSMLLGLILMAGVLQVIVDSMRTGSQIRLSGEVADTGRFLTSLIREEVSVAGYYGELDDYDTGATAQPNPCGSITQANMELGMTYPLNGRDSVFVDSSNFSCSSSLYSPKADTDILVIRRANTVFTEDPSGLDDDRYYLQTTPTEFVLDEGDPGNFNLTQKDGVTPARIREFQQTIYYVSNYYPGDQLRRRRILASGIQDDPIAVGVVDFQVEYGIDRSGNGSPNADSGNAAWVEAPTAAEWDDVVAVRFYFLVRSYQNSAAVDTKTYSYADKEVTPNTRYEHGVFSSSAQVTNVAIRRLVQ